MGPRLFFCVLTMGSIAAAADVGASPATEERLARFRETLATGEADAVAGRFDGLLTIAGDEPLEIRNANAAADSPPVLPGETAGLRRFRPVRVIATRRLLTAAADRPELLKAYRRRVGPLAEGLMKLADRQDGKGPDLARLWQIIDRFPSTDAASAAADTLAKHFDALGESEQAKAVRACSKFWKQWPPAEAPPAPLRGSAGNRNGLTPPRDMPVKHLWTIPLAVIPPRGVAGDSQPALLDRDRFEMRYADPARPAPPPQPVVAQGNVLINELTRICAYSAQTGETAVGSDGVLFEGFFDEAPDVVGAGAVLSRDISVSPDGKLVFARLLADQLSPHPPDPATATPPTMVVGLDLTRQGRLILQRYDADARERFVSAPVSDGQRAYAAVATVGESAELFLDAFSLEDGERVWRRRIARATSGSAVTAPLTHGLSMCAGAVLWNSDRGVVASVRAVDGALNWLVTYQAGLADGPRYLPDAAEALAAGRPPLVAGSTLIVAPRDTAWMFALDAFTAQTIWQTRLFECGPNGDRVLPVAVVGDRDGTDQRLLCGGDRLRWFDMKTGRLVRRVPPVYSQDPMSAATHHACRLPAISEETGEVLWPTAGGFAFFHVDRGTPFDAPRTRPDFRFRPALLEPRTPLHEQTPAGFAGRLYAADGLLLAVYPEHIAAFEIGAGSPTASDDD